MNYEFQWYKNYEIQLIKRDYTGMKAKRFRFAYSNQNIWIPNFYLEEDGTIKPGMNIDFCFRNKRIVELAMADRLEKGYEGSRYKK